LKSFTLRRLCVSLCLFAALVVSAGDTVRPGLEGLDWGGPEGMTPAEGALVNALAAPLTAGRNCEAALQAWFDGRLADSKQDAAGAAKHWQRGLKLMANLKPLAKAKWAPVPDGKFKRVGRYPLSATVEMWVVSWDVDKLKQYGVVILPANRKPSQKFPLILYMHGAAYGVPVYALPWLAQMAEQGYVIVGPALRGEDLFAAQTRLRPELEKRCEGEIENLDGEVNDALSAVSAARKLPFVKGGKFAVLGHSFGSGVGMLAAARHPDTACVISYDAWLTNPFRFYSDRMRRGANNWLSWADFCNQPVKDQLAGLMKRSIVHNADKLHCPVQMFIGGAYEGSVFHQSHDDLIAQLKKYRKTYTYEVVPDGGHNFVLWFTEKPAKYAYAKHMAFLKKHVPPVKPTGKAPKLPPVRQPPPAQP